MDRLSAMEAFVAVAETSSFTRAAARLRISTPMVTLHVARMEEYLGVRLFHRTTRRVDLTEQGQRMLQQARDALAAYAAAVGSISSAVGPTGRVRIDAPASVGLRYILPCLADLRLSFPDIAIELSLGDRGTIYRIEGFDIILRVGEAPLAGWVTHALGETRQICVAAPGYLADHSYPASPHDLDDHTCILYSSLDTTGGYSPWIFTRDDVPIRVRPKAAYTFNDGTAILSAARNGLGIAQHLELIAQDDIRSGALVQLLGEWTTSPIGVVLMSEKQRYDLPQVRAVMDYLTTAIDWRMA